MKTLLFRGKVIPHTCLPAGARISDVGFIPFSTFEQGITAFNVNL